MPEETLPGSWWARCPPAPTTPHLMVLLQTTQAKGDSFLLHSCQELGLPTVPITAASPAAPNFPPDGLFWKAWIFFSCLSPSQWCGWISEKPVTSIQHSRWAGPEGWLQKYLYHCPLLFGIFPFTRMQFDHIVGYWLMSTDWRHSLASEQSGVPAFLCDLAGISSLSDKSLSNGTGTSS